MNCLSPPKTPTGEQLLAAHLESLDPEALSARERLELELGSDLARKLIFALAARRPARSAA